jgi:hypothetical protein
MATPATALSDIPFEDVNDVPDVIASKAAVMLDVAFVAVLNGSPFFQSGYALVVLDSGLEPVEDCSSPDSPGIGMMDWLSCHDATV